MWTSSTGRIMALAQFRDNILVASAGPRATSVVRRMPHSHQRMELASPVPVYAEPWRSVYAACMTPDLRALGVCMHRAKGIGTCIAHPSAFIDCRI